MAIVEMRRVTILGRQSLHDAVLKELQDLGIVQIEDVRQALTTEEQETFFRAEGGAAVHELAAPAATGDETARVAGALDLLDRFFRPKKGMIETFAGIRYPISEADYREQAQAVEEVTGLVERAAGFRTRLTALEERRADLLSRQGLLGPWAMLDAPREEIHDTRLFRLATGQFSPEGIATLAEELAAVTPAAGYEEVSRNRDSVFAVLHYPKKREEEVLAVARRHGWSALVLPDFEGKVADELARIEAVLAKIPSELEQLIQGVKELNAERVKLYSRYEHLRNEEAREETKGRLGYTDRLFVLRGWTRARDVSRLAEALERLSPALVLEAEVPAPGEVYPVDLENPAIFRPFEVVTRVAGLPAAGALDPSPYLAPFFFIFFGLMLGDAAYGIMMIIAGLWLVKRAKAVGLGRQLMYLLSVCGISTFIAGVLTGSWFGNLFGIQPLWFDPMKDPLKMLILSMVLGVIQIFTALAVKAYDNIRKGNRLDALYDQGFWFVFLSGLIMLLLGAAGGAFAGVARAGKYVALAGAIALVLTQGRDKKNIFLRLGSGILSLYGVSGYLSDVLSYSRLLALGLSGVVIAMVLNYGAMLVKDVPLVGWLLMLLLLAGGHIFNILISAIGAYVHASRLQYVEFFTKFFEAGGRPFKPFAEGHRHLLIEADAAPSKER